jgi:hypothetical protein
MMGIGFMRNKAIIITCYIGKLPEWIDLWIKSCGNNPEFDFLLCTNQVLNNNIPPNMKVLKTDLEELKLRFSNVLGFECNLEYAYKICDYKVIYGLAFKDITEKYDFWGHCDVDMIFGKLSNFVDDAILDKYDRVFEVGHLSLYRNTEKMNNLYKEPYGIYSHKQVYTERKYYGFDEHTGMTLICNIMKIPTYNKVVCADINPHYRMFVCMDEDSTKGNMTVGNDAHQVFGCEDGAAYRYYIDKDGLVNRQEVSYIHFMRKNPKVLVDSDTSKYIITNERIVAIDKITKDVILSNDNYVDGVARKLEYLIAFYKNGYKALTNGQLILRIKLRIGRIKTVNRLIEKNNEYKN